MTHTDSIDFLQRVTSSGADIDVLIGYDKQGKSIEYKAKITTATTTDISFGVGREVDINEINLFNTAASVSNEVTVQKNVSGTIYKIIKKTLATNESLNYAE